MCQTVYLAGPITGLNYGVASDWRIEAEARLEHVVTVLSPMRNKAALASIGVLEGTCQYGHVDIMSAPSPVFARDRNDVKRSDILLVNFLGAERVSIGTVFEIAMAVTLGKLIVLVMEPEGNPHDHLFVTASGSIRVDNMEDGLYAVTSFLGV